MLLLMCLRNSLPPTKGWSPAAYCRGHPENGNHGNDRDVPAAALVPSPQKTYSVLPVIRARVSPVPGRLHSLRRKGTIIISVPVRPHSLIRKVTIIISGFSGGFFLT